MKKFIAIMLVLIIAVLPMTVFAEETTATTEETVRTFPQYGRYDSLNYDYYVQMLNGSHNPVSSDVEKVEFAAVQEWKKAAGTITFASSYNLDEKTYLVTDFGIGGAVFMKSEVKDAVTDLMLPDSVTRIGSSACANIPNLVYVYFPSELKSIGSMAFWMCNGLTDINLSETSCEEIGDGAFSSNYKLENVSLPSTLKTIGDNAFASDSSLKSIVIPNSVTSIGNGAFGGCSSLESITIPARFRDTIYDIFPKLSRDVEVTYTSDGPESTTYKETLHSSDVSGTTGVKSPAVSKNTIIVISIIAVALICSGVIAFVIIRNGKKQKQ